MSYTDMLIAEKVKLLRATQALLLEMPEQFCPYETSVPAKGTEFRGCICCYICKAAGHDTLTPDQIYDEVRQRLRPEPVDELFTTDQWPSHLLAEYLSFEEGSLDAAKVACKVIDYFISTYYSNAETKG